LTAVDPLSGVEGLEYSLGGVTWIPYTSRITLSNEGTVSLRYRARDRAGNVEAERIATIKIDKTMPVASAGPDQQVNVNAIVTFNGSGSTDNVGVTSYQWDFGDDQIGSGASATHTYQNPGTYTVTLSVRDAVGNIVTDSMTVTVTGGGGNESSPWTLYAIIGIVAAAAAVVAVWLLRRR